MSDGFKAHGVGDLSDLNLLPGEFRAFRSETRDLLSNIARSLQVLGQINERLDVIIDRQNHAELRMDDLEKRLALLERKPTRRTSARKKRA